MTDDHVRFERDGSVGVLTFNRPERLNALSGRMVRQARERIAELEGDATFRVLIVTGEGRGFCSGADLGGDARLEASAGALGAQMERGINGLVAALREARFPTIAAVNGPAAGAGVGLALACDFLIAAQSMRLLLTFGRIGLAMDGGVSQFLTEIVGRRRAGAAAMLMEPIDADRALDWGLAWRAVPDETLTAEARALAGRLADGPPLAYAAMKRQLQAATRLGLRETLQMEAEAQDALIRTADAQGAIAAYRNRQAPRFEGR